MPTNSDDPKKPRDVSDEEVENFQRDNTVSPEESDEQMAQTFNESGKSGEKGKQAANKQAQQHLQTARETIKEGEDLYKKIHQVKQKAQKLKQTAKRVRQVAEQGGKMGVRVGAGAASAGITVALELAANEAKALGKATYKAIFKGDTKELKSYVKKRGWLIAILLILFIIQWLIYFTLFAVIVCMINFITNNPAKNIIDVLTGTYTCDYKEPTGDGFGGDTVKIIKTGPEVVSNPTNSGPDIKYTITTTYDGLLDILITDKIPENASFATASGTFKTKKNNAGKVTEVTWLLSENSLGGGDFGSDVATQAANFTLTLRPTQPDSYVINIATAQLVGEFGGGDFGGGSTGNTPASNNTCNGVYKGYMDMLKSVAGRLTSITADNTNFGDPKCELVKKDPNNNWIIDKDKMLAHLKDKTNLSDREAEAVFYCIIPKESSYNSNAFNPKSTSATSRGTPGAFGNFQMNAKGFENSGQPEDVGDVAYPQQIANAIAWKTKHNKGKWSNYWPESYQGCLRKYGQ